MTKKHYSAAIDAAIAKTRESGERETVMVGDVEIYAYRHKDGVAFGVNGPNGVNVYRAIRTPDNRDIAES